MFIKIGMNKLSDSRACELFYLKINWFEDFLIYLKQYREKLAKKQNVNNLGSWALRKRKSAKR